MDSRRGDGCAGHESGKAQSVQRVRGDVPMFGWKKFACVLFVIVALLQIGIGGYRFAIWKIKLSSLANRVRLCTDYSEVTNLLQIVDSRIVCSATTTVNENEKEYGLTYVCCYKWLTGCSRFLPPSCEFWTVSMRGDACENESRRIDISIMRFFVPFVSNDKFCLDMSQENYQVPSS